MDFIFLFVSKYRDVVKGLGGRGSAWPAPAQSFSPEDLARRTVERRAVEAVIWGMPTVNYDLMFQEMITRRSRRIRTRSISMPFINTKDVGPMVIEIPPADDGSINGTIMDVWQMPLEDVDPAGIDKGKGGKYLILPPGYKAKAPAGCPVRQDVEAAGPREGTARGQVRSGCARRPIRPRCGAGVLFRRC
jgi:hypothetical protein